MEDYWVFEHSLKRMPANRWRLAGRLAVLPSAVEQRAAAAGPGTADAPTHQQQQKQQGGQAQQVQAALPQPEPEMRVGHVAEQQRLPQRRHAAAAGRGRR